MISVTRHVYVISDLHLGGVWPKSGKNATRGFRMMTNPHILAGFIRALTEKSTSEPETELVINGDFIDFLAEEHNGEGARRWFPFVDDPEEAVACFQRVVERERDREVFDELAKFVRRGHALTILLGNHDIELSLPVVRRAFERRIGVGARQTYRFLYDGEAYVMGNALIEHGNRYDPVNIINHDGLRRVRSLQSRGLLEYQGGHFEPPVGSSIVVDLMNPIKEGYPFIDLLKPESEPLFALLLALEPGYRKTLRRLAKLIRSLPGRVRHRLLEPTLPSFAGDIAARGEVPETFEGDMSSRLSPGQMDEDLREVLAASVDPQVIDALLRDEDAEDSFEYAQEISAGSRFHAWLGLAKLLASGNFAQVEKRLHMVQESLRALDEDRTFEKGYETGKRYRDAAESLSKYYRVVVFGHTHHAKQIKLESGATYLNTGTWANLMRFPDRLFDLDQSRALEALKNFFEDLRDNKIEKYLEFHPTYVRLEIDANGKANGQLYEYDPSTGEVM